MALKKTITLSNGKVAEYHNIGRVALIPYTRETTYMTKAAEQPGDVPEYQEVIEDGYQIQVTVHSYENEEARRVISPKTVTVFNYSKRVLREGFDSENLFGQIYAFVKEQVDFADAEDC